MKETILITGAAGFVGSNIAKRLADEGYPVMGIDDLSFGDMQNVPPNIDFSVMKFQDLIFYDHYKILIHCATSNIIYAMTHPVETFENNAHATIQLFKQFQGKIIYTSTSSVYGNADIFPTPEDAELKSSNAYDISKRLAEAYLQQRGNYITLRLSNVYGYNQIASNPYCGVIGRLVDCALTNKLFYINGNGNDTRDYTFVEDVVEALQKAVEKNALNTEINIGTGVETSVDDLCEFVAALTGTEKNIYYGDKRAIDKINRRCLDIRLAKRVLDWEPKTELRKGLKKTISWYAEQFKKEPCN